MRKAIGHAFEARVIGELGFERTIEQARVRLIEALLDRRELRVPILLNQLVQAAVTLVVARFLAIELANVLEQARFMDMLRGRLHRLDQIGFEIGHGQRESVEHVRTHNRVGSPDRIEIVWKLEVERTNYDLVDLLGLVPIIRVGCSGYGHRDTFVREERADDYRHIVFRPASWPRRHSVG